MTAAQPEKVIRHHLPDPPPGRTIVLGAGKASAQMARAFEAAWPGALSGLVVTQYGAGCTCRHIRVVEAAHPVPDEAGETAAAELLSLAEGAGLDDLVVALISGGGSALLPLPAKGLTLADEQALNRALLASGAPISKMNIVRKAFSRIKGGRLAAAAAPARVVSLILSDVPGDDPALVASGPTVAGPEGLDAARSIVEDYAIELSQVARRLLNDGGLEEPPRPDDTQLRRATHTVIASAKLSLDAAADEARANGCTVRVLGDAIEGEARTVGTAQAQMARELLAASDLPRPLLILSGGETTVTLGSITDGRGGRNTEFLLAAAIGLAGMECVHLLAADTDGRDGSEMNAGAFADGTSVSRLSALGHNANTLLDGHRAYDAFELLGDLLMTGPTGTNVNDFRAILLT